VFLDKLQTRMTETKPIKIFFSAGESSGDQHAANMFMELKKQRSDIQAMGMGGAKMQHAGIDVRYDSSAMGVIGVVEVVKHYAEIIRALKTIKQLLLTEKPDLLVCVDYKEFNFKLARFAKQNGIKVLFYVSPQIWAWRPGRVKEYGAVIDMMAVIFPFEVPYYTAERIPVRYVGHPSVDKVHPQRTKVEDIRTFSLEQARPIVGILPGSRRNEIERMLPVMLAAAHQLQTSFPGIHFLLPQADSIPDALLAEHLRSTRLMITVIKSKPYDVIQCCDAIMTTSGTASLEIALLGVPMVIAYKLSPLTYWLGRLLVKTPFIGLPNIMLGKTAVKELIQHQANAENLVTEISKILKDQAYADQMRQDLHHVKELLGEGGGSKNMALLAMELLGLQKTVNIDEFFASLEF
jgi:lipid-A-disaccharide synthase